MRPMTSFFGKKAAPAAPAAPAAQATGGGGGATGTGIAAAVLDRAAAGDNSQPERVGGSQSARGHMQIHALKEEEEGEGEHSEGSK